MKIVVVSDTHSNQPLELPPKFSTALEEAELLIHCGDFVDESVYQQLFSLMKGRIMAVAGNSDSCIRELPNFIETVISGFKVMIMHGHQTAPERLYRYAPEADFIIFGHLHHPGYNNESKPYTLNPGSLTNNRYLPYNSFAQLELSEGFTPRVEFIRLPKK